MVECMDQTHLSEEMGNKQMESFGLKELFELREQLEVVLTQLQTVMGYSQLESLPELTKTLK